MDNSNRKILRNVQKAVESLLALSTSKVSFHLAVHTGGKTKSFGTKHASEQFETVRNEFEEALLKDDVDMCNPEPGDLRFISNNDNIAPNIKTKIRRQNFENGKPERLPYPLRLMNKKEQLSILRQLIVFDRQSRLKNLESKIVSAQASWEPSFWLNNEVKWTELNKNIGCIKKEDLPNHDSPNNFFTRLIANAFIVYKEDPETYVDKSLTRSMVEKRMKCLGMHDNPHVVEEEGDSDPLDVMDENAPLEDDSQHFEANESFEDNDPYELPEEISLPSNESERPIPPTIALQSPIDDTDVDSDTPFPVFLQEMVPKMELKGDAKGGLSLVQSLALKYGLNVDELHKFSTKQLIQWWIHLKPHFKFPLKIFIENQAGERSTCQIDHQYELFDFLKSEEYKHACNTGDAELELLASIIRQPIHLLVFNKMGYPPGTADVERCEIRTVEPKKILMDQLRKNKFVQTEDVFLLHDEKNHNFKLLVEKQVSSQPLDSPVVSPEEANTFINNLHTFLNPVEESNLAREEPPATPPNVTQNLRLENMRVLEPNDLLGNVQCSIFPGEESFPPSAEPQTPTDSHHGKIRLSE